MANPAPDFDTPLAPGEFFAMFRVGDDTPQMLLTAEDARARQSYWESYVPDDPMDAATSWTFRVRRGRFVDSIGAVQ